MLQASFGKNGTAAVSGAVQYDTGQRIRLYGLPGPLELAEKDDFLSGDAVTVQAQFAYVGDGRTEARLATWDEENWCWIAPVPDIYLQRHAKVDVYVYVSYGKNAEEGMRSKTLYEAVFTPASRPAPSSQVTPAQKNAWDELVAEINLTLSGVGSAISNANAAAAAAREAAEGIDESTAELAKAANSAISGANTAKNSANTAATAANNAVSNANTKITQFNTTVTNIQNSMLKRSSYTATLSTSWSGSGPYTQTVSVSGLLSTDKAIIDVNMDGVTAASTGAARLEAYGMVGRIAVNNGSITAYCYEDKPTVSIPLKIEVIR